MIAAPRHRPAWLVRAAAVLLALLGLLPAATAQEYVGGAGNWSSTATWAGGVVPPSGPNTALRFDLPYGLPGFNTTNDLGNFSLNGLLTSIPNPNGVVTVVGTGSNSLTFTGANPFINAVGSGDFTVASPVALSPTSGPVTISGGGAGDVSLSGVVSGSGQLVIDRTGSGRVTLSGANTYSGGTVLRNGNLVLGALGTGPLTIEGGALTGGLTSNDLILTSNLNFIGSSSLELGPLGTTTGAGGIRHTGSGTLIINNQSAAYTGSTVIDTAGTLGGAAGTFGHLQRFGGSGTLALRGFGSILNSPEITVTLGQLSLGWTGNTTTGNKIGDAVPVTLNRGTLRVLAGLANPTYVETIGALRGSGFSEIDLVAQNSGTNLSQAGLIATDLVRVDRGTFAFTGTNLGNAPANGVTRVRFGTTPTLVGGGGGAGTTSVSIIPFAIGGTIAPSGDVTASGAVANSFVTYDGIGTAGNGVRLLNLATEYATSYAAAGALDNLRLTAGATGLGSKTVNSLLVDNTTGAGYALTGSGTLTVGSGAMLFTGNGAVTIGGFAGLNFNGREAVIHQMNTSAGVVLNSPVTNADGLTKSGPGTLILRGANNYTGQTTVNGGALIYSADSQLGSGNVTLAGGTLFYAGAPGALNWTRTVTLAGAGGGLGVGAGVTATLDSTGGSALITGSGTLYKAGAGTVVLRGANDYTGPTVLNEGVLEIDRAAALGTGTALTFRSPQLQTIQVPVGTLRFGAAGITLPQQIAVVSSGVIDTNGFDATLSGPLTSGGSSLLKAGAGALTLTGDSPDFVGNMFIGGDLVLAGGGRLPAATVVATNGRLTFDNTGTNLADRMAGGSAILERSELRVLGNGAADTVVSLGNLSSVGQAVVTISPGAGRTATLAVQSNTTEPSGGMFLVRGPNLGAAPGADVARLTFATPTLSGSGPAGTPTVALIVGGIGDTNPAGTGAGFLAHGPNGVRLLTAAEYAGTITPGYGTGPAVALTGSASVNEYAAVNALRLTGPAGVTGSGAVAVSTGLVWAEGTGATLDGPLVFGTAPTGMTLYTTGALTVGPNTTLAPVGSLVKAGEGTLTLNGGVAAAQVRVAAGTLTLGPSAAVNPTAAIVISPGATFDLGGADRTLGSLANSHLPTITGAADGTGSRVLLGGNTLRLVDNAGQGTNVPVFAGVISGTGGLVKQSFPVGAAPGFTGLSAGQTGTVQVLQGANAYTGVTTILNGRLLLNGPAGSIAASSAINIAGGALEINNESVGNLAVTPVTRVSPTASISLAGELAVVGNSTIDTAVPVGPVTLTGGATLTVTPGQTRQPGTPPGLSATASLTAASLTRTNHATVLFRGTNLGLGTEAGPNTTRIEVAGGLAGQLVGGGGAAGTTTVSILPWALGDTVATGNGSGFVTYGPTGVRPLAATEYAATIAAAGTFGNVRTTVANTVSAPTTINSLYLQAGGGVSGTGPLTLRSGAVGFSANATIGAPLDYAGAEAVFLGGAAFNGNTTQTLTVSGAVQNAAGLTKGGNGTLALTGTNTFTGDVTINSGVVQFGTAANLGDPGNRVVMGGPYAVAGGGTNSGPRLSYTGASALTLNRPVVVNAGLGLFDTTTGAVLTLGGPGVEVSGAGGVGITGGAVTLTGTNTYAGPTRVVSGTLRFTSDAALGSGPLHLDTGSVALTSTWATARTVYLTPGVASNGNLLTMALDTGAFTATLSGPVTGGRATSGVGDFAKQGTGTLILSGINSFQANVRVDAGVLSARSDTALGLPTATDPFNGEKFGTVTVSTGAALQLQDNVTIPGKELYLNGSGVGNTGALRSVSGTNYWTGLVELSGFENRIGVDAGRLVLTGPVVPENAPPFPTELIKVGAGTLELNGTATNSRITVAAGTLAGIGSQTGLLAVNSGAALAPGAEGVNGGVGTYSTGATALNGGATFRIQVAGLGDAVADRDQLAVTGGLNVVATTGNRLVLAVDLVGNPAFADGQVYTYTIATTTGGVTTNGGTFDPAMIQIQPSFGDLEEFQLVASGGNLVLRFAPVPVPEPAGVLAVAGLAFAAGWSRRRGRNTDVVRVLRPEADARPVVEPQSPPLRP